MRRMPSMLAILALLCCLAAPGPSFSAESASDDAGSSQPRAEAALLGWLQAFNSQDEARYGAYVRAHAPELSKYIRDDHRFAVLLGGLRMRRMLAASDTQAEAELVDPYSDAVTRLTIKVSAAAPYPIVAADLAPPAVDTAAIPQFRTDRQLVRELHHRLELQSRDQRFSGVVLVSRRGKMLFSGGYGDFDRLSPGCAASDVPFSSASVGKMLTATALLQLKQQGKVDLDAPLSRYLPELPAGGLAAVTLRQLLNHTGGAGDFMVDPVRAQKDRIGSLSDIVALLKSREPEYAPGSKFSYANYGYILLGRVIEKVSGQSYFDYLRGHIIAGLAIPQFAVPRHLGTPRDAAASRGEGCLMAGSRTRGPDGVRWVSHAADLEELPTSAGGIPLTAGQLNAFAAALLDGTLLGPAERSELMTGTVEIPNGRYALGAKDLRRNGLRVVSHGGSAPGTNHEVDLYPDSGYVVVVLTNRDPPYGNRVADFVGHRMGVLAQADRVPAPAD